MKRRQAFKFKLKTKSKQAQKLWRFAGSCRYVYNHALALQKECYESGEKKLNYAGLCKTLSEWKNDQETAWLNQSPSQSLQQALKDLERAYQNFFAKRSDFPRFKKRGIRDAIRYPQGYQLDQKNHRVFLPKLGWIKYFSSQVVLGEIKNITVSHCAGNWYVSIQTEREISVPKHAKNDMVGIDVGIAKFATLSNRTTYEGSHVLKQKLDKLKIKQRQLSKKVKFSQNWFKQKRQLSRFHHSIANARLDHLHKISHEISKNHAMIMLEDLKVKNMSKSASGTIDKPGKKVKAKSSLNRSILDQGWGEFRRQLIYKSEWVGGAVILVNPKHTSITCPRLQCRHISQANRKSQSEFKCIACGYEDNADYVGATNILAAGRAVLAGGESMLLGRSMKQESNRTAMKVA